MQHQEYVDLPESLLVLVSRSFRNQTLVTPFRLGPSFAYGALAGGAQALEALLGGGSFVLAEGKREVLVVLEQHVLPNDVGQL